MAGDTTITVIGNLTDDPELRFTPSGAAVAKFRVASTPRFMDLEVDEIGPSLRYATAKVQKMSRSGGGGGGFGGGGGQGGGGGNFDDPWASAAPAPSRGGSGGGNFDEEPPF